MQVSVGKIATVMAVAMAALASYSCGNTPKRGAEQAKIPTPNVQTIKISPEALSNGVCDTLRFGVMRQGEQVIKDLRLENTSEAPMVLLRHVS